MSALHEAVARAIGHEIVPADDATSDACDRAAAAAIRVVLAESTRSIEALPMTGATYFWRRVPGSVDLIGRAEALAVLAALGEQA